jgi:hypothetical protein
MHIYIYIYISCSPVRTLWIWISLLRSANYDRHHGYFAILSLHARCQLRRNNRSLQSAVCYQCLGGLSSIKGGTYGNIYERQIWKQSISYHNSYYGNSANNGRHWNVMWAMQREHSMPPRCGFSVYGTFPLVKIVKSDHKNWIYKNEFPFTIILDKYYNIKKKISTKFILCAPHLLAHASVM